MTDSTTTPIDQSNQEEDYSLVGSDDYSFVDVGSCNLEFLIKIVVRENGTLKHHRVRLRDLVNTRGEVSFSKLKTHVKKIAVETGCCRKKLELCYKDEDEDLCLITSTGELLDAIHQFVNKGCLKLEASSKRTREQQQHQQEGQPQQQEDLSSATISDTWNSADSNHVSSDLGVSQRILRAMRGSNSPRANGVTTDLPESVALSHLLDDFQEHINLNYMPTIAADPGREYPNKGPLFGYYTLKDGTQGRSNLLAMDDIYLDLNKSIRDKCVCIRIPVVLLKRLQAQFDPEWNENVSDDQDTMFPIYAFFCDPSNPPLFVTLEEQPFNNEGSKASTTSSSTSTGIFTTKIEGTLAAIMDSSEHRVFKTSAVFKIVNRRSTPRLRRLGEAATPTPTSGLRHDLEFSLVALRVFSAADET